MKLRTALAVIILLFVGVDINAGEAAIEWAPFVKAPGVTDEQLIVAANVVNSDFLIKQNGFVKRELIKKNDSEYSDVIYWETKADAIAAGEKVNSCVKCNEYFNLMDMGKKSGEGFSQYIIIKSWKR